MATDIGDKELKALRDGRWEKAFGGQHDDSSVLDAVNRKATIVIEHLIQASDVVSPVIHCPSLFICSLLSLNSVTRLL